MFTFFPIEYNETTPSASPVAILFPSLFQAILFMAQLLAYSFTIGAAKSLLKSQRSR